MKWNIVTDSSCDLKIQSKDDDIKISSVPFVITIGDEDFVDDENLDTELLARVLKDTSKQSHTSCPAPNAWIKQFIEADQSIAITISSKLSGSLNSAKLAKDLVLENYPEKKIAILDSRSTGPELVLCVEEIEKDIKRGLDFDDVINNAERYLTKTKVIFALSSFDNLVRNGRMSKTTGFIAKTLKMWGIGSGSDEGKIVIESKKRGNKKMINSLITLMKNHSFNGGKVAISHFNNLAIAQALKAHILEIWKNAEVIILPVRGLCAYYAEEGGIIVSYES